MAKLLAALGTSYSPLLAIAPEDWASYCKRDVTRPFNLRDGTSLTYDQLHARNGDKYASRITLEEYRRLSEIAQGCLNRIAAELAAAQPDVIVVVADDHSELFDGTNVPLLSVYRGAELPGSGADRTAQFLEKGSDANATPAWRRAVQAVQTIDRDWHYPGSPVFADQLVTGLIERNVDVAVATEPHPPSKAGLGFAWGFVINRLLNGRRVPIIPVLLNTYYPPNVPTPGRCHDIGEALHGAIAGIPDDRRVVVICCGGLSHVGIDEDLDRTMLTAARTRDVATLKALPRTAFISGTCQLLTWILLAGVAHRLESRWLEYLPVYRSPAGTGIGLAFGSWS